MTQPSLIALTSVKDWLNTGGNGAAPYPPDGDALLSRLVASASNFASVYCSRPIAPITVTEVYSGTGRESLTLRQQPVLAIRSLTVGSQTIAARVGLTGSGYVFDNESVSLCGFGFCHGRQNISITYDAGYQTTDALTVQVSSEGGSGGALDVTDLSRPWNSDRGVAYATGTALVLVTTAPALGQYQITVDAPGNATYLFNASDVGATIVVTYGYTPEDMAAALVEWVGERFKTRSRIGITSQTVGMQQSNVLSQKDMNESIRTVLGQYRNVVPIQ